MELCYLLAFPDMNEKPSTPEPFHGLKDAPYFQPVDIDLHTLGMETVEILGHPVSVMRQRYDGQVQVIEFRFEQEDPFAASSLQSRRELKDALQARFIPAKYRESGLFEEYIILLVKKIRGTPDKWIDHHGRSLAKFLRAQREVLDRKETDEILASRVRYSKQDLTLVEWEGAVILAADGDFASDILLLKIGNYQLIRYRMLDKSVETLLDHINESFFLNRKRPRPTRGAIRRIVEHRLEVMLDFERAEQNLLLIGDWYTAKLYKTIRDEFYLEEWKNAIRGKLDNLESITQTIKENFTLSVESLWSRIEMAGWAILLIGYIYLFFADVGLFGK
ncbi:MAG: hypothetical protein C4583_14555 [Anaerolineaceae bacterium]|nr:MAG: hypothetical protein C4583_14555 [Anaerolineaceae bacterium]